MNSRSYPDSVDVAIVGSGPAGATYARVISELAPNASIAMFEVGPTISAPAGAHVKNIADEAERARAQSRSEGPGVHSETISHPGAVTSGMRRPRPGTFLLEDGYQFPGEDGLPVAAMSSNVGGMAAHWTGACPRPGGAERIDFVEEMDEWLSEGERLLGVTQDAFAGTAYGDLVRERLSSAVDACRSPEARVQPMPLAVHRRGDGVLVWSGSDVVMGDLTRDNTNFKLFDETLVTRITQLNGEVTGVIVRDRSDAGDEREHAVRASFVVVAADALRTPQLLWASDIRPPALGRYLNDQTQIVYATRIRDAVPSAHVATAPKAGLASTSGVTWVPYTDTLPFHGQIMQLDASPIPLADDDPVAPGSIVGIGLFCAKDLQAEDRIEFDPESTDRYGMPAMRIHYRLTDNDARVIARAQEEIVTLAKAVGEPLGDKPFTMPLGASLHYQGSTRMGSTDDGSSVCDVHSEVWGTPGLFVAGNGVIPTATACNPTLTNVALAIGGAREIAARLT